jgi:2'-5' RNA ligase
MKYRYVIVGLLPDQMQKQIAELQQRYEFRKQTLPPHITIIPPFQLPGFQTRASILQKVKFSPVQVVVGHVAAFRRPDANIVYLQVASPGILMVIDICKDAIPALTQVVPRRIQLHITIAKGVPDADLDRILSELKEEQHRDTFTLEKLTLFAGELGQAGWNEVQ